MIRDWEARWYVEGDEYADLLHKDLEIHRFTQETIGRAGISRVKIERFSNQVTITIWAARRAMRRAIQAAMRAGVRGTSDVQRSPVWSRDGTYSVAMRGTSVIADIASRH